MMRNGWQSSYCWKEVRVGKAAKLTRKTCWFLFWFRAACITCPGLKANELVEVGLRPRGWEALDGGPWRARGLWGPESTVFSVSQFSLPLQFGFDVGENLRYKIHTGTHTDVYKFSIHISVFKTRINLPFKEICLNFINILQIYLVLKSFSL